MCFVDRTVVVGSLFHCLQLGCLLSFASHFVVKHLIELTFVRNDALDFVLNLVLRNCEHDLLLLFEAELSIR